MPPRKRVGRTAHALLTVRLKDFGWDSVHTVTLRHSTLPWHEQFALEVQLDAFSLSAATEGGTRDALSLLGQYAAHVAFLRFAAVPIGEFDPAEWAVIHKRGCDSRLVRVRANKTALSDVIPAIAAIEAFAKYLRAPALQSFQLPWCKPEIVYQEVERKLRGDVRADHRWLLSAACGWIVSPGAHALRCLHHPGSVLLAGEQEAIEVLRNYAQLAERPVIILGDAGSTPLQRYSALGSLAKFVAPDGDESATAERIADQIQSAICVVASLGCFDESSRRVLRHLRALTTRWSWVLPQLLQEPHGAERAEEAARTIPYVVSPRLAPADALYQLLSEIPVGETRQWLAEFVQSDAYGAFLDEGRLPHTPAAIVDTLSEPRRSFLAAVAILGSPIDLALATTFLKKLGSTLELAELAVEGVSRIEHGTLQLISEGVRKRLLGTLSSTAQASLASVAARLVEQTGGPVEAAKLFVAAGENESALRLLERVPWDQFSVEEALRVLDSFPRRVLAGSPSLSRALAESLIASGRYLDARPAVSACSSPDQQLLAARIERRLGNYSAALDQLKTITDPDFEALLLRAEVWRLTGDLDQAGKALGAAAKKASQKRDRARYQYERAILDRDLDGSGPVAIELAIPYLDARLRCYDATTRREHAAAIAAAEEALRHASGAAESIDAALDRLYALFLAGEWEAARHQARQALALVEETQGDRAAGGILFTLAYLCADSAHFLEAEHALDRLRRFYRDVADSRRLDELRMLSAHLDLCRGRFHEARRHLAAGAAEFWSAEIREAAHLDADELDWIDGKLALVRTTGDSACLELTRRHELNLARSLGHAGTGELDWFSRQLFEWESGSSKVPQPTTRAERVRLYRCARAMLRRCWTEPVERLAHSIATELQVDHRGGEPPSQQELQLLRRIAVANFPFEPGDFGDVLWRFASRNRFGQWTQLGSLPPLQDAGLAEVEEKLPHDWAACTDSTYLFMAGLEQFDPGTRDAIRSLINLKADRYRLQRVAEQETSTVADRPAPPIDGILGESPRIREITAMLDKLARRDVAVCVLGESGTGKELFARAIHQRSPRRSKPFTAINCAALPETLIESELFGHARGAFSGADRDRPGLLEVSDGGTLFLDEIGELPLTAQAKVLRFLQEGEYRRVGETAVRHADVRVIAATNRKLEQAVDERRFREDLYYRIRGVELQIPPLRERASDVLLLARHFLARELERNRSGPNRFSESVEAIFFTYQWPGNVRELQNTVRAGHALAGEHRAIEVEHLPKRLQSMLVVRVPKGTYYDALLQFRRSLIEKSLLEADGNQNRAAKALGMTRQALAYQIRELGILVKQH